MQKSVQNQSGILMAMDDLVRIELIFIDQAMLIESDNGKDGSDQDENDGHGIS